MFGGHFLVISLHLDAPCYCHAPISQAFEQIGFCAVHHIWLRDLRLGAAEAVVGCDPAVQIDHVDLSEEFCGLARLFSPTTIPPALTFFALYDSLIILSRNSATINMDFEATGFSLLMDSITKKRGRLSGFRIVIEGRGGNETSVQPLLGG